MLGIFEFLCVLDYLFRLCSGWNRFLNPFSYAFLNSTRPTSGGTMRVTVRYLLVVVIHLCNLYAVYQSYLGLTGITSNPFLIRSLSTNNQFVLFVVACNFFICLKFIYPLNFLLIQTPFKIDYFCLNMRHKIDVVEVVSSRTKSLNIRGPLSKDPFTAAPLPRMPSLGYLSTIRPWLQYGSKVICNF